MFLSSLPTLQWGPEYIHIETREREREGGREGRREREESQDREREIDMGERGRKRNIRKDIQINAPVPLVQRDDVITRFLARPPGSVVIAASARVPCGGRGV